MATRASGSHIAGLPPEEIQRLVHELQTQQIDLEVQNQDLRRAQAELGRSRDRFNDLYDFAPVGYLTLDGAATVLEANLTAAAMLGVERAELVGHKFHRFVARGAREAFRRHQSAALASGKKQTCEMVLRGPRGRVFWARLETISIQDSPSDGLHCRSAIVDLAEHKEAQAALEKSEERYRNLFDTMIEGFCIIEMIFDAHNAPLDFRFLEVNPAFERHSGLRDAKGRLVRDLAPELEAHWFEIYGRIALTGEPARFVNEARALKRWYDVSAFRFGGAGSRKVAILFNDITEHKRLEAEVLQSAEEERMRIAADLHDGICQELVGLQFLSTMLQRDLEEARNPLAASARRIGKAIIKATEHTRQVARGMNPVVADGSGLMHALRRLAQSTARAGGIRCPFECPAPFLIENPAVANELFRIAQEAIHNALRHGRAKRIVVRLREAGGEIRLAVIDDGCGLPPELSGAPGMGLRMMKYRAGLIGGRLVIQPGKRRGAEVICHAPNALPKP
jgi:PAS domain S-box-containing protein